VADTHAERLKELVPAFEAFDNTISEDQKKTADALLAKDEKRRGAPASDGRRYQ